MAMASCSLSFVVLLSVVAATYAATFNVNKFASTVSFDGGLLGSFGAVKLASPGDTIVFEADIEIPRPLNILKSLTFVGNGKTLSISYTGGYGVYIKGGNDVKVSFSDLTFDGEDLVRIKTQDIRAGRGAAIKAGIGAVVQLLKGSVLNNFAPLGGALEQSGGGFLYACNIAFSGNTANAGISAVDMWQGQTVSEAGQTSAPLAIAVVQGDPVPVIGTNSSAEAPPDAPAPADTPKITTIQQDASCPPVTDFVSQGAKKNAATKSAKKATKKGLLERRQGFLSKTRGLLW
eukprot:jgi/Mesen1/9060/ME000572S08331